MNPEVHPDLPHHLPFFITPPGVPDVLLYIALGILLLSVFLIGILYLKLHAIPEHLAHRGQKIQFQLVAVLALLALFTHIHLFWIAALLLALVEIPDFSTPVRSMARSLDAIARRGDPLAPPATRDRGDDPLANAAAADRAGGPDQHVARQHPAHPADGAGAARSTE